MRYILQQPDVVTILSPQQPGLTEQLSDAPTTLNSIAFDLMLIEVLGVMLAGQEYSKRECEVLLIGKIDLALPLSCQLHFANPQSLQQHPTQGYRQRDSTLIHIIILP